jgi:excisionase family DNA binding protein
MATPTEIMTIQEVAEYLKLYEKTAYRLASEGEIPGFKVGGSWRFRRQDIEHWIARKTDDTKYKYSCTGAR